MRTELEKQIAELKPGGHLCLIYEDAPEQMAAIVPFVKQGLARGECCLYIADDDTTAEAARALAAEGVDVPKELERGALVLLTKRDTYVRGGLFEPEAMIELLRQTLEEALAKGFAGLRATGEMTWALGPEMGCNRLIEYEAKLNTTFPGLKALIICQYHRRRFAPAVIRDVLRTHPVAIVGHQVCPNPYYESPDLFFAQQSDAHRIDWMMANLQRMRLTEEELQKSVGRLELIARATNDAVWDWDLMTNAVWWNEGVKTLFGYPRNEVGSDVTWWYERIHPQDRERVVSGIHAVVDGGGQFWSEEYRYRCADGSYASVFDRGYVMHDNEAKPVRMVGAMVDITERKRMEEALRQSEKRYRALYEDIPSMYFTISPNGVILSVNQFGAAELGYTVEELVGKSLSDVVHKDDLRTALEHLTACFQDPTQVVYWEFHKVRKDGSILWVEESARSVPGTDDAPVCLVVCKNITGRKQLEEALRAGEERFRILYHDNPSMYFTVDPEGLILSVNQFGAGQLGYSVDELVGKSIVNIAHDDDKTVVLEQIRLCLQNPKQVVHREFRKVRKNGSVLWVKEAARAIHAPDTNAVILVVREDITERKRAEATRHALYRAGIEIQEKLELRERLDHLLETAQTILEIDRVNILLADPTGKWLEAVASLGVKNPVENIRIPIGPEGGALAMAYLTQQAVIWDGQGPVPENLRLKPPYDQIEALRSQVFVNVPLVAQGRAIGVLGADRKHSRRVLDSATIELLQLFAAQATVAIQNAQLFEQVRAGRERLRTLSRRLVAVQEAERRHLARELHDEIGQILTGIKLTLEMGARLPPEAIKGTLDEAQILLNDLMTRVRELSLDLRPAMLDDLGVVPALLWHFERFTAQTQVRVTFTHSALERRLAPEVETAAYRIVQEALTNVVRHAGVNELTVNLCESRGVLTLQIQDRGRGFNPEAALTATSTSGLAGMRERAELLGGQLRIQSAPGAGTCLEVTLPLTRKLERRKNRSGHHVHRSSR